MCVSILRESDSDLAEREQAGERERDRNTGTEEQACGLWASGADERFWVVLLITGKLKDNSDMSVN